MTRCSTCRTCIKPWDSAAPSENHSRMKTPLKRRPPSQIMRNTHAPCSLETMAVIDVDSRCLFLFLSAGTVAASHSTSTLPPGNLTGSSACDLEVLRRMIPRFSSEASKHLATHAAEIYPFAQCLVSSHIICALIPPHNRRFALALAPLHLRPSPLQSLFRHLLFAALLYTTTTPSILSRKKGIILSPSFAIRRHLGLVERALQLQP